MCVWLCDICRQWYWKENTGSVNWQQLLQSTRNGECFIATRTWAGHPEMAVTWCVFHGCYVTILDINEQEKNKCRQWDPL